MNTARIVFAFLEISEAPCDGDVSSVALVALGVEVYWEREEMDLQQEGLEDAE